MSKPPRRGASPLPSPAQTAVILGLPHGGGRALPLRDVTPDPGLFGPASVTWRLAREPLLVLGGARALMMQLAHPLVAAGVADHSAFNEDPFRRLVGTVRWVATVIFGTRTEAEGACARLRSVHGGVHGTLHSDLGTAAIPGGTRYDASASDLGTWVLVTLVDTLATTYGALVRSISREDIDAFAREWRPVAALLEVDTAPFESAAALQGYIALQLDTVVRPGAGSRAVVKQLLACPFPDPMRARGWDATQFIALGLLPSRLRAELGLPWSPRSESIHRFALASMRGARRATPRPLRSSGSARFARQRLAQRAIE